MMIFVNNILGEPDGATFITGCWTYGRSPPCSMCMTEFCAYTKWSVVLFAKMASLVSVSDKKLTWLAGED